MRVFLVNPSDVSFGTAVITPRWLYVLAAATPSAYGDPLVIDETLAPLDLDAVQPGDVVGIGIHTSNAFRGYALGRLARERGATWCSAAFTQRSSPMKHTATVLPTALCEAMATSCGARQSRIAPPVD